MAQRTVDLDFGGDPDHGEFFCRDCLFTIAFHCASYISLNKS